MPEMAAGVKGLHSFLRNGLAGRFSVQRWPVYQPVVEPIAARRVKCRKDGIYRRAAIVVTVGRKIALP